MTRYGLLASIAALGLVGCGGSNTGSASTPPPTGGQTPAPTPTPTPTPSPTPSPDPTGFTRLVFEDQFAAGTLNRAVWNVEGPSFWVNNEQQAYVDSQETIAFSSPAGAQDGAALVLRARYHEGFVTPTNRRVDFLSGRIDTANTLDVTYGRVESRIRMPRAQGAWPAFWMLGYGQWPDAGETDIMEYIGEAGWTSSSLHGPGYSAGGNIGDKQYFPAGQSEEDWHVYAVERRPDDIRFFVDDREFLKITRADVEKKGAWRFDRKQFLILNLALGGEYPRGYNTVTAPYYGLPQATVDKIKADQIQVEVDWVRVWE